MEQSDLTFSVRLEEYAIFVRSLLGTMESARFDIASYSGTAEV